MRRRDLIAVFGTLARPSASRAQQTRPVGDVHSASSSCLEHFSPAVREALDETGYVEARNLAIFYSAVESDYDPLPELVAASIERKVAFRRRMAFDNGAELARTRAGRLAEARRSQKLALGQARPHRRVTNAAPQHLEP